MKVLLISASYHPVLGGLQTVTRQLARSLSESGHEVKVVTNRYPRSLPALETVDGIGVERWPFLYPCLDALRHRRLDLALAGAYYNPAAVFRFARLAASFNPDVVNVHFPEARLEFVLRARRRFPFRLVVSLHGDEIERWFKNTETRPPQARRNLDRLREFLRSADAVTACSQYLLNRASALEPSISGKAQVVYNGYDTSRFTDRRAFPHPRPYVLAYGRHTYKKGFDLLLKAFAVLAERLPHMDLILAGDGEQSQELAALREALGLRDRVILYGRANPEEVIQLLNGCRLVVIPSREEPFGIVAMEAIASGRPVVATRAGGLPEAVAAATASYSGDTPLAEWAKPEPQDLADSILRALSRPRSDAGSPAVRPGVSVADMTRRYAAVLSGMPDPRAAEAGSHSRAAC